MPRIPKREVVRDWYVVLEPADNRVNMDGRGVVEILRGDEQDAVTQLNFWAAIIEHTGRVPRSMDWQNDSMCAVIRRQSRRSYRVRCDSFEFEGDNGSTEGYGWLRVIEAHDSD